MLVDIYLRLLNIMNCKSNQMKLYCKHLSTDCPGTYSHNSFDVRTELNEVRNNSSGPSTFWKMTKRLVSVYEGKVGSPRIKLVQLFLG